MKIRSFKLEEGMSATLKQGNFEKTLNGNAYVSIARGGVMRIRAAKAAPSAFTKDTLADGMKRY